MSDNLERCDWTRLLVQIGSLTVLLADEPEEADAAALAQSRDSLVERAQVLRKLGFGQVERLDRMAA